MKEVQLNAKLNDSQPQPNNTLTFLKDIYTPLGDQLVFEFEIITKTKGGVELPDQLLDEYRKDQKFANRVIATGPDVKSVKIGDWIITNPNSRVIQIPLIYNGKTGLQHGQIHEYDVLGIVNKYFAQLTPRENTTIN